MDEPEFERRYYVYPFVLIDQARSEHKLGRFSGMKLHDFIADIAKQQAGRIEGQSPREIKAEVDNIRRRLLQCPVAGQRVCCRSCRQGLHNREGT